MSTWDVHTYVCTYIVVCTMYGVQMYICTYTLLAKLSTGPSQAFMFQMQSLVQVPFTFASMPRCSTARGWTAPRLQCDPRDRRVDAVCTSQGMARCPDVRRNACKSWSSPGSSFSRRRFVNPPGPPHAWRRTGIAQRGARGRGKCKAAPPRALTPAQVASFGLTGAA